VLKPESIKGALRGCGYKLDLLKTDFAFGDRETAPLVGFAQPPADSRSACIAVLSATTTPQALVETYRPLGAPLVFVCFQDQLQWWKQGTRSAEFLESIPATKVEQFFRTHQDQFSPDAVYRAKTWGRFKAEYQLSFVDMGLMPLVEEQVGKSLGELIERSVCVLKKSLGWSAVTDDQGHWLLQSIFWLVSGKILRDKHVEKFDDLNLDDVEGVFLRLGRHYGTEPLHTGSKRKLEGLREAARAIDQFSSLTLTTTESLAHVYENTLISKETRSSLGTHSTPSYLVDYVVGNLTDWIKEIPVNERSVFEPACGHAAFLVSAMRLLTELLPPAKMVPSWRGPYLRRRLHGTDIDPFALELARLSLTLTDIPNPDGWDLSVEDMFLGESLSERAKGCTILLANPPFDNFSPSQQQGYRKRESPNRFVNKAAEVLWRTLPQLAEGGVFGVVVPQTLLHSGNARDLRRALLRDFEIREICLFPDKVFSFSDAESAILIGRRARANGSQVRYRHIREGDLQSFRSADTTAGARNLPQSRFSGDESFSLRLPDLEEVWNALADNPTLDDVADLGRGFEYHSVDLPSGSVTFSDQRFPGGQRGFLRFDHGLQLHELPRLHWLNLDPSVIRRPVSGTLAGTPQVLLNYAPVSRGPWRLKALVDRRGLVVTSNFIAIRPTKPSYSLEVLWSLLNSPLANAYAFSHLSKRHNIVGDIRRMPVPREASFRSVERAAVAYLDAASSEAGPTQLQNLLLRVDCEVLKLYSLPAGLEQSVLAMFTDWKRVGVPFTQTRYLPKLLDGRIRLADFLLFDEDWSTTNRERGKLIDRKIDGVLTPSEQERLDTLQAFAEYHIDQVAPRPAPKVDQRERSLFPDFPTKGGDVR
jgi:hypothetical protein